MKRLAAKLLLISLLLVGLAAPLLPITTYATAKDDICTGITSSTGATCGAKSTAAGTVDGTIAVVINLFSLAVGIASVIMIIVGGFKYVVSQGEGANTASAKNTILYAVVGLVVVGLAQIIVKFVLERTP